MNPLNKLKGVDLTSRDGFSQLIGVLGESRQNASSGIRNLMDGMMNEATFSSVSGTKVKEFRRRTESPHRIARDTREGLKQEQREIKADLTGEKQRATQAQGLQSPEEETMSGGTRQALAGSLAGAINLIQGRSGSALVLAENQRQTKIMDGIRLRSLRPPRDDRRSHSAACIQLNSGRAWRIC